MSTPDYDEPLNTLKVARDRADHQPDCSYGAPGPDGDFCDCGLSSYKKQLDAAIKRASAGADPRWQYWCEHCMKTVPAQHRCPERQTPREELIATCKRVIQLIDTSLDKSYQPLPTREFYVNILAELEKKDG